MRTVMVTKFVPSSQGSGGQQRTFALVERLAARGSTTVCCFDDGSADPAVLRARGVRVRTAPWQPGALAAVRGAMRTGSATSARFWSKALADAVHDAVGDDTGLLLVEHLQMAPYAAGLRADMRVLDLHNIESDLVASYAATRSGARSLPFRLEARALRRVERRVLAGFDRVVVVSERDRDLFAPPGDEPLVCPNGWEPRAPSLPAADPAAVFVATMGWAPNADAARWLGREIWPRVTHRVPGARLSLVGRDPTPEVRALQRPGLHVTGAVESVEPFLSGSRLALAPLRAGGGSRLKILEALGAGRPVVATTVGASGLEDLVGQGVVVADGPDEIAASITWLLEDPAATASLGRRGSRAVAERYAWDRTLAPLFASLP